MITPQVLVIHGNADWLPPFATALDVDALAAALGAPDREEPVDGVLLLQELVVAAGPRTTRVEIVGGEVVCALTADTSQGFELCPADACRIEDLACPAPGSTGSTGGLFALREDVDEALLASYVAPGAPAPTSPASSSSRRSTGGC